MKTYNGQGCIIDAHIDIAGCNRAIGQILTWYIIICSPAKNYTKPQHECRMEHKFENNDILLYFGTVNAHTYNIKM